MLSSKERLLRIFAGKDVDRPALKLWGAWDYKAGDYVLHPRYIPLLEYAALNTDLVVYARSPFNVYCGSQDKISSVTVDKNDPKWLERTITYHTPLGDLQQIDLISKIGDPKYTIKYAVQEPEDLKKILSMSYSPYEYSNVAKERQEQLGDRGIAMFSLDHPGYALQRLIGSENLALFSYDCRQLLHEVLEVFSERIREHVRYALDIGVRAPFSWVGPELLIPPLMSMQDFEDFCFKYDKQLCDLIHEAHCHVWVHVHGKVRNLIRRFIDMGVDILNPLEPPKNGDVDMAELSKVFKGAIGLEGNIEIQDILLQDKDELAQLIEYCVCAGVQSGRFILCPSAGFMEYAIPDEKYIDNLRFFIDYGKQCIDKFSA